MTLSKASESSSTSSPRAKSSRSTIRHSLGLAGKAFVDAINKDGRDGDKSPRRSKNTASRRLSALSLKPAAPRTSMGDTKSSLPLLRTRTPESKTVTRRRVSVDLQRTSMDEQPSKSVDSTAPKTSTLRPRNPGTSSVLPKYRPKSVLAEGIKPPSPKVGTRRPLSSSEDEKDNKYNQNKPQSICSPTEKTSRPISPLPQRVALKSLSSAVNATPPSKPSKAIPSKPSSSSKPSPQRPTKIVKTAASTVGAASGIPRPSSSNSSSGSFITHTPKTPNSRSVAPIRRSAQETPHSSPSSHTTPFFDTPVTHRVRSNSNRGNPSPSPAAPAGNMSHISEGGSEDSEAEDVALLLAPVAALGAPTPAMPRIQGNRNRKRLPPQTPTRADFLPTRADMSYVSPVPPGSEASATSFLRPPTQHSPKQFRASILSWEQLANEASKTLGEDEIERMLSDIPAPFHPVSPTPSTILLDVPESPCISALSSPGGYGSISQVLLPDVTPSPAIHHTTQRYDVSAEVPAVDAAIVTLLRLQLAAAENVAKERLHQLQAMEEEIHHLKQARGRETEVLMKQVAHMEERIQESLKAHGQAEEERTTYISDLEAQLRQAHALKFQRVGSQVVCSARVAASEWESVRSLSDLELDLVQGDRQVLSVLLVELEQMWQSIF